jgi:NTE family protein
VEKLNNLLAIAGRSISVMIAANERASIGAADLVVMPGLDGLTASDYLKWSEFVERGVAASEKKKTMLERFSVSEAEYAAFQTARQGRRRPSDIRPQVIEVDQEIAPRRRATLVASVKGDPNKPADIPHIEEELTKLTGMGRYESATYGFVKRGASQGIRVMAREKEQGPPFLRLGLLLDASRQEGFRFGIGGRLYFLDFGGPASEWRTDLSIGVLNKASTEYYYRLKGGKWFIAPRFAYTEDSRPLYQNDEVVSDFITREMDGAVDLGYAFGRFRELRAGYTVGNHRIGVTKGVEAFEQVKGRYSDVHLRWAHEGQDSALVPRRGQRLVLSSAWVLDHPGVKRQYLSASATYNYARPFNDRYSLQLNFAGGAGPNEEALNAQFTMGGVYRLDALARSQLNGSRFYYGGARLLRTLGGNSLSLFGKFYLAGGYEVGKAWAEPESGKPRHSVSGGLLGETIIGVVYFGAAVGDQGDRRLFLRVGRVF